MCNTMIPLWLVEAVQPSATAKDNSDNTVYRMSSSGSQPKDDDASFRK